MVDVKERKIGRIRLKRVQDASGPSLEGAVKEGVEPGSTVHTDGWRGYGQLSELGIQLSHLDYYLDEFTFRFNRRTSRSRGKLFYRLVQQAAAIGPVHGHDILGGFTSL